VKKKKVQTKQALNTDMGIVQSQILFGYSVDKAQIERERSGRTYSTTAFHNSQLPDK